MKNSFFLILLLADFALGQKTQTFLLPKELFLTPQTGDLMRPEFLSGNKVSGYKNLEDLDISRQAEMTLALQGRFSHKTTNGASIFIIQEDHMPCSVPRKPSFDRMSSKIPENFQSGDPMPNALPRVQTIPPTKNPN
jgi:hypothetical protein